MIENMRGRSTETKYGRIPLWIYETGVSLQAIATYGWLHGRYGHYERVVPSYATLAKELGVSRGSVIAYVKELTRVGAVRIAVSGAAGQQTNLYEIAFNEPFEATEKPAEGGQDADPPVSGLYRSGQRADRGGQPVGHEEDVPKKTKKTLSPRVPQQPAPEPPAAPSTERETTATPNKPTAAQRAVRASRAVAPEDETAFIAWITATCKPYSPGWWRTAADDLPEHADTWRAQHRPAAGKPAHTALPAWCRKCDNGNPAAEHNIRFRYRNGQPCPACHPDAMPAAA